MERHREEAHDERGGEKENRGDAARTMGEAQESDIRLSSPQAYPYRWDGV